MNWLDWMHVLIVFYFYYFWLFLLRIIPGSEFIVPNGLHRTTTKLTVPFLKSRSGIIPVQHTLSCKTDEVWACFHLLYVSVVGPADELLQLGQTVGLGQREDELRLDVRLPGLFPSHLQELHQVFPVIYGSRRAKDVALDDNVMIICYDNNSSQLYRAFQDTQSALHSNIWQHWVEVVVGTCWLSLRQGEWLSQYV